MKLWCAQCIFTSKMSSGKYVHNVSEMEALILYTAGGVKNTLPVAKFKFKKKSECNFANNDYFATIRLRKISVSIFTTIWPFCK